jgi:signal transduction histidine kinase
VNVDGGSPGPRRWAGSGASALLVVAAMVGCYQAGAWLGFRPGGSAWPFWPANGLVFAVLVRRSRREWLLLAAAQVVGELLGGALAGVRLHQATAAYALLDAGESALAAALVCRRPAGWFDLRSLARVRRFLLAALLAVAAASALAAGVAALRGAREPLRFLANYAVGDLLGYAVVAPAMLRVLEPRHRGARVRRGEAAALLSLLALLGAVTATALLWPGPGQAYALLHAVLPLLAWAALRVGTSGGSGSVLVVASVSTVLTALGHGPFVVLSPDAPGGFVAMQVFLAFVAATALLFAAAVAERRVLTVAMARAARAEAVAGLASGVAQDFGSYLALISGYADALEASRPLPDQAHRDLDTIRETAHRASDLARQLVAVARRQGAPGDAPEARHLLDLRQVVSGAEGLARRLAGARNRLVVRTGSEPVPVRASRTELERVLFNLVSNARDAVEEDGEIVLEVRRHGDRAVLVVADDGPGMDETLRARAFEPYFTTKAPGRGTGLGLPTAREVVARAGGRIELESAVGRGTRVVLELPLAP